MVSLEEFHSLAVVAVLVVFVVAVPAVWKMQRLSLQRSDLRQ